MGTYFTEDYVTEDGRVPIQEWLSHLSDRQALARILMRVKRLREGNFGHCKPVVGGVWELKINCGPGYRIYYARVGDAVILLLAGGHKRKQQQDIDTAVGYWKDWNRRCKP